MRPLPFYSVNKNYRRFSLLLISLLAFGSAGCHKKAVAQAPQTLEQGVAELRTALVTASPEVQSNFYHGVSYSIRYGDYASATFAVQQMASDPNLSAQQKQAASAVGDLLKQEMDRQQAKPQ